MNIKYEYDPTPSVEEFIKMGENAGRALFGPHPNPHSSVTEKLKALWDTFSLEQKVAINELADDLEYECRQQAGASV